MTIHNNPPATIKLSEIHTEFGGNYSLDQYYRGGSLVPNTPANAAISTSGLISLSMFYGASSAPPVVPASFDFTSNGSFRIPVSVYTFYIREILGGGGGGAGSGSNEAHNVVGDGGGNGDVLQNTIISCNPNDLIQIIIGIGGVGGVGQNSQAGSGGNSYVYKNGNLVAEVDGGVGGYCGRVEPYIPVIIGGTQDGGGQETVPPNPDPPQIGNDGYGSLFGGGGQAGDVQRGGRGGNGTQYGAGGGSAGAATGINYNYGGNGLGGSAHLSYPNNF